MDWFVVGVFTVFLLVGAVQRAHVLNSRGDEALLLPVLSLGIVCLLSPFVTVLLRGVARWLRQVESTVEYEVGQA